MIIKDIYLVVLISTFVSGLLVFKFLEKQHRQIFFFVLLGVITELFSKYIYWLENTMPIGHYYIPLSFLIIALFYRRQLKGYLSTRLITLLIAVYLGFCVIYSVFIKDLFQFPNLSGMFGALILLGFAVALFHKIMIQAKYVKLINEPVVWFNSALLFYYSGNLFFYALFNYMLSYSNDFLLFTFYIYSINNVFTYVLLGVGFWVARKKSIRV